MKSLLWFNKVCDYLTEFVDAKAMSPLGTLGYLCLPKDTRESNGQSQFLELSSHIPCEKFAITVCDANMVLGGQHHFCRTPLQKLALENAPF